jgi:hypothetical protein
VQREDHAERDHPGRGGLLREVDQVVRGQEVRVEHLEHEPDEHEDHGDGQDAEVARAQALPGGCGQAEVAHRWIPVTAASSSS